jgi:NAD(P)-dependent dehydrogenase (short-subunit alcohol dehydrogenase family)
MQKNTGYVYISLFSVFLCLIRNFSDLYASFKAKDKSSGEYSPFYPSTVFRKQLATINSVNLSNFQPYTASKHAVLGLTQTVALEVAQSNIRVNAVCPGVIDTDLARPFFSIPFYREFINKHPMGRVGKEEEVANVVVFLCSDQASFITEEYLVIDRDFMAQ